MSHIHAAIIEMCNTSFVSRVHPLHKSSLLSSLTCHADVARERRDHGDVQHVARAHVDGRVAFGKGVPAGAAPGEASWWGCCPALGIPGQGEMSPGTAELCVVKGSSIEASTSSSVLFTCSQCMSAASAFCVRFIYCRLMVQSTISSPGSVSMSPEQVCPTLALHVLAGAAGHGSP